MRVPLRFAVALALQAFAASADEIASADLLITGSGLTVVDSRVETAIDIPASVQTEFGRKRNDEAPFVPGLLAVGELSGPGLDAPLRLETTPGHPFRIPGLRIRGEYALQNIRLTKDGAFLQPAAPSFVTIDVRDVLQTSIKVKQLTAEDLRSRGIALDGQNYDYYEYTLTVTLADGETVEVPYVVALDPRTHQARPIVGETPYALPPDRKDAPPRWSPPKIAAFELVSETEMPFIPRSPLDPAPPVARPSIPAAIVIPNDIAVLHQFFEVGLMVRNGASAGSSIELDSISATIRIPSELRVTETRPAVTFGQPVPILEADGLTILRAQAEGNAEWILEALRAGSFTIAFDLRATYRVPGQPDVPLRAAPQTTVHVHDPRFGITFSHPDVVRKGIDYSTFSFVTNLSPAAQSIRLANGIPPCTGGELPNACRPPETPETHDLTLAPGEMKVIEYRLRPGVTGHAYASAGSVDGDAIAAAVRLHMGVDENGIPLSPATLLLPHYTRYLDPDLVDAQLELLGLGYSLATAPLNQATAKFPRVMRGDVFERAADLARAGQRAFIGEPEDLALFAMNIALLGNEVELREWDDLRRMVDSGWSAQAAIAERLETAAIATSADYAGLLNRAAVANAHREAFLAAVAHASAGATRPLAVALRGATTGRVTEYASGGAAERAADLPFAAVAQLDARDGGAAGALALVGRWTEDVELIVTPLAGGPITVELIHPSGATGRLLRTTLPVSATPGEPVIVAIAPGQTKVEARNASGAILAVATPVEVSAPPLQVVAARQDLHLDEDGHRVSVLFNRPIANGEALLQAFGADALFNGQGLALRRPRPISGAALQSDGRIVNLNFDHILSKNATYELRVGSLVDPLTGSAAPLGATVQPVVDDDRPAGLLFGKVLRADNTPVAGAEVALSVFSDASLPRPDSVQFDAAEADGIFFFEFVPRDPILGYHGLWRLDAVDADGKAASLSAAIREPGSVQVVNLVYLGRGAAEGYVRYDDGTKAPGAAVTAGSTMRGETQIAWADANGFYRIENLPVGPLTFSAKDDKGRIAFAANEVRGAGAVVVQDLVIPLVELTGRGSVRGTVIRSDDNKPVAGARVGIFSRGYAIGETYTGAEGRFAFESVPAGYVTVLAAEWSVARVAAAQDLDLRADATRELTMILEVAPAAAPVRVAGSVTRADPLNPAARHPVPAAMVKIEGLGVVTADAAGAFVFDQVPPSLAGRKITAWDPETGRAASRALPSPLAPSNSVDILVSAQESGMGTIRVRLVDAAGFPLDGFDVFVPAFPARKPLQGKSDGIYELAAPVGRTEEIWAVARGGGYGSQYASGRATVAFEGQIAPLNLRLPGQGRVRVAVRSDIDLIAEVTISTMTWDDGMQSLRPTTIARSTQDAGGGAGFAIFDGVPALAQFTVTSAHPVHGAASASGRLAFDGDVQTLTLQLDRLASLAGVVYAIDGRTPVAGAAVRLVDERQDQGATTSGPDGSFSFRNLPAAASVRAIASVAQDGIYRTGYAEAKTPATGGAVENVAVVLRRRGTIKAQVVWAGYRVFDPQNPSNNVPDDTPGDLSDNAPVRRARLTLRELGFPSRSFGSATEPLVADDAGRLDVGNVFEGPLRASAWDPASQELRGEWSGALVNEGDEIAALVGIGGAGVASLEARVLDPMQADAPVLNAEVLLLRSAGTSWEAFDFASTDGAGEARFEMLPAGAYRLQAYAKAEGRSGASGVVTLVANEQGSVSIHLEHGGAVAGEVIDPEEPVASDRPVAGSHVTLDALNYDTRATTDGSGSFQFEGVREGTFTLTARDPGSNRRANATLGLTEENGYELTGIVLALEPTAALHVAVYLPADDGSSSGVLAPAIGVDVKQRCSTSNFVEFCDFYASLQENPAVIEGMLADGTYHVAVREIGGQQRTVSGSGEFPNGSAASPLRLVLPAFGSVRVQVIQAGQPAAGARVTAAGGGKQATAYADATGTALLAGLRVGAPVSIQARSLDGAFTGSTAATIASQSTPAAASVELGSYAALSGFVEAEAGGPSIGTSVAATFGGRSVDTVTDGAGRYLLLGIPTSTGGTAVALSYLGPDGLTIGARQETVLHNGHAGATVELPPVRLDATPPRLLSITPRDGAAEVPPDAWIRFVFSEPIRESNETSAFFKVYPADSASPVGATFEHEPQADGTYAVTLVPSANLKSNTLYRILVAKSVADASGHALGTDRGASFVTTDYAEPRIARTEPPVTQPLQAATTFRFVFNEPLDPAPWAPGGAGSIRLFRIAAPGGAVVAESRGRAFLDPAAPDTLVFSPDEPIEKEALYRATVAGARDPQGNTAAPQSFEWASFDETVPFVTLVSPAGEEPLVSGSEYTLVPEIRNGSAGGTLATDIERVEYFRVDGEAATYLTKATAPPFSYRFVAPEAPAEGATIAYRAIARDRSLNESAPATIVLPVRKNEAPKGVAVVLDPPAFYAAASIAANVGFADEGTLVTVQVALEGTKADGAAWSEVKSKQVTRASIGDPWPAASIAFTTLPFFRSGSTIIATARVTDVRGLFTTATASASVLADTQTPMVTIIEPPPGATFAEGVGNAIPIRVTATDGESGISGVTASIERGATVALAKEAGDVWKGTLPVPSVDDGENVSLKLEVTASDRAANTRSEEVAVWIDPLYDPNLPVVTWLCPTDGALFPAGRSIKLRIRALGNGAGNAANGVESIALEVDGTPVSGAWTPVAGSANVYETTWTTPPMPSDGHAVALRAVVRNLAGLSDGASARITIVEGIVVEASLTIDDSNAATFENRTVIVASGTTTIVGPRNIARLVILDGATVTHRPVDAVSVHALELGASALYVACGGSIDATGRGYDGSLNGYARTWPNTFTGGSVNGSGGSHGGSGGSRTATTPVAAAYGSVVDPNTPGGAGAPYSGTASHVGAGGGIVRIASDDVHLDGAIVADGVGDGTTGGGAGGSIRIDARRIHGAGEIRANGVPAGYAAGGGGRIALYYETLAIGQIAAKGGLRTTQEDSRYRNGSAGTIYLREVLGSMKVADELIVGNGGYVQPMPTTLGNATAGTITAASGKTLTLSAPVSEWIAGAWIEILGAGGAVERSYAIAKWISANSVEIAADEAPPLVVPVEYRIVWKFDKVTARDGGIVEIDGAVAGELSGNPAGIIRIAALRGGDVVISGHAEVEGIAAQSLRVVSGGRLSHPSTTEAKIVRLEIDAPLVIVEAGGSIDVSGRGFDGASGGYARTWPNATAGGSADGSGGSHGGSGGRRAAKSPVAAAYGSVMDPNTPGGSGAPLDGTYSRVGAGGGIVRIRTDELRVDGDIRSNGVGGAIVGGGAGGSIRIDASRIRGVGSIAASGAYGGYAGGGGGRIALYYGSLEIDRGRVSAAGALRTTRSDLVHQNGAAGTVYLRAAGAPNGELVVSNGETKTTGATALPAVGYRVASAVASQTLEDAAASMLAPDHLRGVRAVVNHDRSVTWPILANSATALTLDTSAAPLAASAGDAFRGLYRVDKLTLQNANLETVDLLEYGALVADAASAIRGNNQLPPAIDGARVSLAAGAVGASIVGTAGAVTDADVPLTAIARNETTGADHPTAVAPDGSFLVAVAGAAGDVISIRARDGNLFPMESRTIVVGALPEATPSAARLDSASWGVDAGFRARTIVRDGSTLLIGSYPAEGTGSSNRVVVLDVAGAAPAIRATVAGTGAIRDLAVHDGRTFVAADRFWSLDAGAAAPAPTYAVDVCGREYALVVSGGYAFGAEGDCNANDIINVYDVSTAAPRYLYSKSIAPYAPYAFSDLFAAGTGWLIGISPDRPGNAGHDLIVIDRRDPNDLKKVAELEIENFDAFRGTLNGDVLWVVSRTSSEVATIDLSNPRAPALIARAYAGASPNGIAIAGGYAIVASGGSGLFAFDAGDPTLMTRAGTTTVAGSAWDVVAYAGNLYVADDTGLSIVPVDIGPVVDFARIRVAAGAGVATVRGLPLAITGGSSPAVEIPGITPAPVAVAPDGSFAATVPARPGQALTLVVRDGAGRSSSHPMTVPFAANVEVLAATPSEAGGDATYRARRLGTDGTYAVATTGGYFNIADDPSATALLFTLPNASAPASITSAAAGLGHLWEVEVVNGRAYMTGSVFGTWNLGSPGPVVRADQDGCGTERGLVVSGPLAFTAKANCNDDGTIFTWDVSSGSPRLIGTSITGLPGMSYRTLLAAGEALLIGISPDKPGGAGRDVTIIDRSNPSILARLGSLDVPSFDGVDGFVHGSTLYMAGLDAGIAIVDISNPAAPRHLATIDTPGIARAVAISGPDEIVAADGGGPGLTFIDVADTTRPVILGSQPLAGNATDVRVIGREVLVATDHHVQIVRRP